ncbi:hypothetical protein ACFXPV_38345 [Streptomyces sp. NPDC059118]|uniref:hypothetical protein n=1 Tax=unclassified Streptomyces TaxID=2593676 RepID=UPI0036B68FCF
MSTGPSVQYDAEVACGALDSVLSEPGCCRAATELRDETAAMPTPVQVAGESRALVRAAVERTIA